MLFPILLTAQRPSELLPHPDWEIIVWIVGTAVLLVSLELDEVMALADRILVMFEGEIVGELDPKTTTAEQLGLYMSGAKREGVKS